MAGLTPLKRRIRSVALRVREARLFARAMRSPRHPVVAHIIPTRRCNLACAYCNEYDDFSPPAPAAEMLRRVDLLANLGTAAITLSGGEPLLHPETEEIVRHIRRRDMIATLITNGYPLTRERIARLNRAGLDHLQISIDNVLPDEASVKSLRVLDKKLGWLAEGAEFEVNINVVVGTPIPQPEDAWEIFRRAHALGFKTTIGLLHEPGGRLRPLNERQRKVYAEVRKMMRASFASYTYYEQFQNKLVRGLPNDWHCHAGSRYLYVCEDGLVHYCSQQRGLPGIPLEKYTREDLEREYHTVKRCAPYCTVSCVHQVALLDQFREKPLEALAKSFPSPERAAPRLPAGVKILTWLFLPPELGGKRPRLTRLLTRMALRLLRVK